MALFPIHAATSRNYKRTALDLVVSSYTTSIRALIHVRAQISRTPANSTRVLLASMPTTPGRQPLSFVKGEIDIIDKLLPQSIERNILDLPDKAKLIESMESSTVAHLACHGEMNCLNPSKSLILLSDWETDPFLVTEMAKMNLEGAELSYLSACHTANSIKLLDEGIHMTSAFQLAGFPRVVGTLWEVEDKYCPIVAECFYASMVTCESALDFTASARALHHAVRKVRELLRIEEGSKIFDNPLVWASWIHVGK